MRTKNALKNMSGSFMNNLLLNILRFISRTIFIKVLGEQYLGINGMLSNVLGILAFADLGIGSAIGYSLYKPLADNDKEQVKALMNFYRKAYLIIAIVIMVSGLILVPFLDFFVKDSTGVPHLKLYYLLFLANMVIGYLFSYKRTLITADQKGYKIIPITMGTNTLVTIFQIIVIYAFKNYFIYLMVQTVFTLIENILVNLYINKKYPYIKEKNANKLTQKELKPIKTNIKALMYHKIGSYFVDSTDNLIISKFIGLSTVGIYSNYSLIINMLHTFINSALISTTAVFGNINVKETPEKRFEIFKTINFLTFIVFGICSLCLYNLFNIFIGKIWIGNKYLLDNFTVLVICIVFYINGLMHANEVIKSSAGLYDKDKYVPIIQSIINVIVSVALVKYMGLVGVFIGTLISAMFVMVVKPMIIYKYIFKRKAWSYYVDFIKKIIVIVIAGLLSNYIISLNLIENGVAAFVVYAIVTIVIIMALIYICFRNTSEYKDLINRIKFFIKNRKVNNNG